MPSARKRSGLLPRGVSILAVFRTLCPEPFDAAALADRFKIRPAAVWRHGEPDAFDEIATVSGFSVVLGKARSTSVAFDRCISFLSTQGQLLAALRSLGATNTINLSLLAEGRISSPAALHFPAELLRLLLETGTELTQTHYL